MLWVYKQTGNAMWIFWMLDRLHKTTLFFKKPKRQRANDADSHGPTRDKYEELFGTDMPASIPESTGWWHEQQKDVSHVLICKIQEHVV